MEMMRMRHEQFQYILQLIEPHISNKTLKFGRPISSAERLALKIAAASHIIKGVCRAIRFLMRPLFLQLSATESE